MASALARTEDIRVLKRAKAEELELPASDFWIFDSKTLATLQFDEQNRTLGVVLSEDPADVLRACRVRDTAQRYAVPAKEFAAERGHRLGYDLEAEVGGS